MPMFGKKKEETKVVEEPGLLMMAKGRNGQLQLFEDKVKIVRGGAWSFVSQGFSGDREIYLDQISSIQLKKPGALTNGYIQLNFLGGTQAVSGIQAASRDPNSIIFLKKEEPDFEKIKGAIEEKVMALKKKPTQSSSLDDIAKLADLRDKNIITEEEFQAKKKQLLGI